MPYTSVSELPTRIKKYPSRVQRMWMQVFNSTYKKVLGETGSQQSAEGRAFMAANSVVKKNMSKFGASRYGHESYFRHLIDRYLGNLEG